MTPEEQYRTAKKRVKKKKGFYKHFAVFAICSVFLFFVNMMTSPGYLWFLWAVAGWGFGVAVQYIDVFGWPGSGKGSHTWEQKEIAKEIEALEAGNEGFSESESHLELRDLKSEKEKAPKYRDGDFV